MEGALRILQKGSIYRASRDILEPVDGRIRCPRCGAQLLRVTPRTRVRELPVYCRRCRREFVLTLDNSHET